jgi:hypothetical protein
MTKYEPEMGQALFGQPYKEYGASALLIAVLNEISSELDRVMWNVTQKKYDSPFGNTGNTFKCDTFEVEAYSWNEDIDQPYNFKWRDVEVSWYKYLGRGMSVNQVLTSNRIAEMLADCLAAVRKLDIEEF